jgi:Holliday junction resolvasome RuvABC ATP-dependent DNA helicase subunit
MGLFKNVLTELFYDVIPNTYHKSHKLFEDIVGYDDIKELFARVLSTDKPIHILLCGPPASAKSLFMQQLMKLNNSYFTLGSHSTKSGIVDAIFEKKPRYLIVDELDKMSTKDQTVLLSLMESGIVSETKYKRTREIQLNNTSVFATANSTKKLLTPLLTRFCVLYLQPYSHEEFREITRRILYREEGIVDDDVAGGIADAVWNKMKSANVRDCKRIGRMAKSVEDVNWIVDTFLKYESNNKR